MRRASRASGASGTRRRRRAPARKGAGSNCDRTGWIPRSPPTANGNGHKPPAVPPADPPPAVEQPDAEPDREDFWDPFRLGRLLIPRANDRPATIYHRAEWWVWRDGRYVLVTDDDIDKSAWTAIDAECRRSLALAVTAWEAGGRQGSKPVKPKLDSRKVSNAVDAAASMVHLAAEVSWPVLLEPGQSGPNRIPRLRQAARQPEYLALANGLLDVGQVLAGGRPSLIPATPLYFTPAALPPSFDPAAKCPKFDAFIAKVTDGDAERQAILQEMTGYLLRFDTRFQQFFVLTGEGGNGKSTFLAALWALLGDHNISSVPLEEFGERFALAATIGKLVNAVAEVGELDKVAEAKLKSFVAGDTMAFDRKNKTPLHTRPTARLLLSCNNLPRFADRSEGVWRRYQLIPFNVTITEAEVVKGMDKSEWWRASGELPGILNWALAGLARLNRQNGFSNSIICAAAKREHRELCNPHRQFLDEHIIVEAGARIPVAELFAGYVEWCRQRGYHPLADGNFGAEVKKQFRHIDKKRPRVNGERQWVYEGINWFENRPASLLIHYDRRKRESSSSLSASTLPDDT